MDLDEIIEYLERTGSLDARKVTPCDNADDTFSCSACGDGMLHCDRGYIADLLRELRDR